MQHLTSTLSECFLPSIHLCDSSKTPPEHLRTCSFRYPKVGHNMDFTEQQQQQQRDADDAVGRPTRSLVEVRVLTREAAMASAGTLVDRIFNERFDQRDLLESVKIWLNVHVYTVLPPDFKYKVSCYCMILWPAFLKRLPPDANDDWTETQYNSLVQESIPKILTKKLTDEMLRDLITFCNKRTVPDRHARLVMRRSLGLIASKMHWQEKKIEELVKEHQGNRLDDLPASADLRITTAVQKRSADSNEPVRGQSNKRRKQEKPDASTKIEKDVAKSESPRVTRSWTRKHGCDSFSRLTDEQCEDLDAWEKAQCNVDSS